MCESPDSLQTVCIYYIARNINSIFTAVRDVTGNIIKYNFKCSSICLPSVLSEQLFSALDKIGLTDEILTIFDPSVTRLQRVYIRDADSISLKGLRILRFHKISELAVIHTGYLLTVNDLIECLGDWTLKNLHSLNISYFECFTAEKVRPVVALSKLKNLKCLDISHTDLNSQALGILTEDLPLLESLNISATMVTDITPLKKCKDRLKYLDMYSLKIYPSWKYISVLNELTNLRHLDISYEKDESHAPEFDSSVSYAFSEFFKKPSCFPHMTSLDVSGKYIDTDSIIEFAKNHPQLKFLGLFEVQACFDDYFCKSTDVKNRKLIVTGHATEQQILEALRRYYRREVYGQKCLCYLYSCVQNISEVRLDIIQLILQSMKFSPHVLGIQMAATACLYNLIKEPLSSKIHTKWLKKIIDLTLTSMQNFPKQPQLQKNSLLTLCSDRMLQDVSFNMYRCAELVMKSLLAFDDPAMNRMSVAICSILTARITTAETSILGTNEEYMERLLSIVKTKSEQRDIDIMMKFTLSALWNLSDESPKTCQVFLNLGGMELFHDVLKKFPGESHVETKVLGLLNNIAEVGHLREHLMKEDFLVTLKSLLHSEHIDVSYFAAGIVAHLSSEGEEFWSCDSISWKQMIIELGEVVSNWVVPEMEMVAYRTFKPFYTLFSCFKAYQIQLWAAWAILHVCSKNSKRYCSMIIKEGGVQILQNLQSHPEVHSSVAAICEEILHIVKEEHPKLFQTDAVTCPSSPLHSSSLLKVL